LIRRPPQAISAERDSVTPFHNDGALWRNNGTSPQFGDCSLSIWLRVFVGVVGDTSTIDFHVAGKIQTDRKLAVCRIHVAWSRRHPIAPVKIIRENFATYAT